MDLRYEIFVDHDVIDTQALEGEIRKIEDSPLWKDPHRGQFFEAQAMTEHLAFVWTPILKIFSTYVNDQLLDTTLGKEYKKITEQVLKHVPGKILRGAIVRMFPGTKIPMHFDGHEPLWTYCHRLHLPVITEPGVRFVYETTGRHLEKNTLVEVNNFVLHGVHHDGDHVRYHVMYDILPESYTGPWTVEYHNDPQRFAQDRKEEIERVEFYAKRHRGLV